MYTVYHIRYISYTHCSVHYHPKKILWYMYTVYYIWYIFHIHFTLYTIIHRNIMIFIYIYIYINIISLCILYTIYDIFHIHITLYTIIHRNLNINIYIYNICICSLTHDIQPECCRRIRKVAVQGPSISECFLNLYRFIANLQQKDLRSVRAEKAEDKPRQMIGYM